MNEITNIKYDLDGTRGYEEYYQHAEGDGLTREQMLEKLPKTFNIPKLWNKEYRIDEFNKDDFIDSVNHFFQKRIEEKTGWLCLGFSYKFSSDRFGLIEETYEEPPFKEQMKKWEDFGMPMPGGA